MRVDGKYLILVVNLNELLPNDLNSRRLLVVSLVWSGPGPDGDDINWIDMQLMGDFYFSFAPSPPVLLLLFPLLLSFIVVGLVQTLVQSRAIY